MIAPPASAQLTDHPMMLQEPPSGSREFFSLNSKKRYMISLLNALAGGLR
jgi:hypothetical protein